MATSNEEEELSFLKSHLAITPKTAHLLHASGFTSPHHLAQTSPNTIVQKFSSLSGMDLKQAKGYLRPGRRMVMLGAIEDADEAARVVKDCKVWSIKHLESLGAWEEGFDDLTGLEILEKMKRAGAVAG